MEKIEKYLVVKTGLHIGGSSDYEIGAVDSVVVKDRELPYIPGSSLKGKIRSLLETQTNLSNSEGGKVCNCGKCVVCKAFGFSKKDEHRVGKIIFRDAKVAKQLSREKSDEIENLIGVEPIVNNGEVEAYDMFEIKFENVIDRNTGTTKKGGLRQIERVVSGVVFDVEIIYKDKLNEELKQYEGEINSVAEKLGLEKKKNLAELLIEIGLKLLENDYLGGSGTRGYGSVLFLDKK